MLINHVMPIGLALQIVMLVHLIIVISESNPVSHNQKLPKDAITFYHTNINHTLVSY